MLIYFKNDNGEEISQYVNSVVIEFERNKYMLTDNQLKRLKLTKIESKNGEGKHTIDNLQIEPSSDNSICIK